MNGLKNVRNRRDDALTRVGWDRLETMLADYYRGHGWSVDHIGTGGSRTT
jgi:restriction system protein